MCDDGHFKSDYSKVHGSDGISKTFWPQPRRAVNLIADTGDVRLDIEELLAERLASDGEGAALRRAAAGDGTRKA